MAAHAEQCARQKIEQVIGHWQHYFHLFSDSKTKLSDIRIWNRQHLDTIQYSRTFLLKMLQVVHSHRLTIQFYLRYLAPIDYLHLL